jgi:hypothetical protein
LSDNDMPKKSETIVLVGRVELDPADLPDSIRAAPRSSKSPRRAVEVHLTEDPALIAWTRKAYEVDQQRRLSLGLEQLRSGDSVAREYLPGFARQPDQAAEALRNIMMDKTLLPESRTGAAKLLSELGCPEGAVFLVDALASRASALSAAAAEKLTAADSKVDVGASEPAARLFNLLSSSNADVARKAAYLCVLRRVPGAEQALQHTIQTGAGPLDELAEALARLATTAESVQIALPYLFRKTESEHTRSFHVDFARVIHHPDPAIAVPFRDAMRRHLLTYEGPARRGVDWPADLAAVADESVIDVLETIVAQARDPRGRAHALSALARLRPAEAVERILPHLTRDKSRSMLMALLAKHAVESDMDRILTKLYPGGKTGARITLEEAGLLLNRLGRKGEDFVVTNLERLEDDARAWAEWKMNGLDLHTALEDLHRAGITRWAPGALLQKLVEQECDGDPNRLDASQPVRLWHALAAADLVTGFDSESCDVPAPHDDLIHEFARGSDGRFLPECPIQIYWQERPNDGSGPIRVLFLHQDRLYHFDAEDLGDYYDANAVIQALHTALETAGSPERYISLVTGGQLAFFVFADPEKFVPFARKYQLPLEQDMAELDDEDFDEEMYQE